MDDSSSKKPWIETPLVWSQALSQSAGCNIFLKLENAQPSGSFKSRGIGHFMQCQLSSSDRTTQETTNGKSGDVTGETHFFCSSGGNAGLACVHAAVTLGCPSTIVVPNSTSDYTIGKLREAGAKEVIQIGASWFEADQHLTNVLLLQARLSSKKVVYVHPFDAPDVWSGHATIVTEIFKQLPEVERHYPLPSSTKADSRHEPDAIVCSVGGGGLFSGIMQGLDAHDTSRKTRVLAVETIGADSLSQAVQAGKLITLPAITSVATTLGARTVCKRAFEYASNSDNRVITAVLPDAEVIDACRRFADDERILVEPSCAVCLALCYAGKLKDYLPDLRPDSRVVIVLCGGSGISLELLAKYSKQFGLS